MRDGSIDDVVAMWVDRMVREHGGRHPGDNEAAVYFALLKKAMFGLLETHGRFKPMTDYKAEIAELLDHLSDALDAPEAAISDLKETFEPSREEIDAAPTGAVVEPEGQVPGYWEGDTWKKDFFTEFSRWFWPMKDYALPAGRRKADFLWDVAEIWVATAATALVYYAPADPERWFETGQLLRHYADLTEEDGLRSLSWGRWARYAKENHRPKPSTSQPRPARAQGD